MFSHDKTYQVIKAMILFIFMVITALTCLQTSAQEIETGEIPVYTYRIINIYPHDSTAFTQGLVYYNGFLYESTGLWGQSSLRKVDLTTGKVLQVYHLPKVYFGEGITLWHDKIIQLTWKSNTGWIYNYQTFEKLANFSYPTEGWGITHDGQKLIMSDGTDKLYFLEPTTLKKMGHLQVHAQGKPIVNLNEMEYIEGEIFANIWKSNYIARISPQTGQVLGWIDLTGLIDKIKLVSGSRPKNVLNGIAYDDQKKRLFVTGKLWPKLFEIEIQSR